MDDYERSDPLTGEITNEVPQPGTRAADMNLIPGAALTSGQLLDILEDGRFSADAYAEIRNLGAEMRDLAAATGNVVKGEVTIKLAMTCEGDGFGIRPSIAVKAPKRPRPKSVAWMDENDRFTRFPPGQNQLFGLRQAGSSGPVRSAT